MNGSGPGIAFLPGKGMSVFGLVFTAWTRTDILCLAVLAAGVQDRHSYTLPGGN
jgi:hypothetical protein